MLVAQGTLQPRDEWQSVKRERYRRHLDSLDNLYFVKAERHMKMLRNWAAGRAGDAKRSRPPAGSTHASQADVK
jgi:hypothetical protein